MSLPLPYYNDDVHSFAYTTVRTRWPLIMNRAIKDIGDAGFDGSDIIIAKFEQLIADFKLDKQLLPFTEAEIEIHSPCARYNNLLGNDGKKWLWLTAPWLYSECYLYVWMHLRFKESSNSKWHAYDVFANLKDSTFLQSLLGVMELCLRYTALTDELKAHAESVDPKVIEALFVEFIDISLWGNATDLSLLAGKVSLDDIKALQGAEVRRKNQDKILANDISEAWSHFRAQKLRRVDIVLDNSGFEFLADLILALFLLDANLASSVHFHCKELPWFVSDTMIKDVDLLLDQLEDREFYADAHASPQASANLAAVARRARHYFQEGKFVAVTHPFWTFADNYWLLGEQGQLSSDLRQSGLVIFKGDLNYRKLTGDLQWEKTTPFKTAIQQLASSSIPVLSLRTCKADVVVGLKPGVAELVAKEYEAQGNEGEFWASSGKWAVVSFSSGQ